MTNPLNTLTGRLVLVTIMAVLLSYAGSVSTLERPWPALAAALVVPAAGAAFMLWRRLSRRPAAK